MTSGSDERTALQKKIRQQILEKHRDDYIQQTGANSGASSYFEQRLQRIRDSAKIKQQEYQRAREAEIKQYQHESWVNRYNSMLEYINGKDAELDTASDTVSGLLSDYDRFGLGRYDHYNDAYENLVAAGNYFTRQKQRNATESGWTAEDIEEMSAKKAQYQQELDTLTGPTRLEEVEALIDNWEGGDSTELSALKQEYRQLLSQAADENPARYARVEELAGRIADIDAATTNYNRTDKYLNERVAPLTEAEGWNEARRAYADGDTDFTEFSQWWNSLSDDAREIVRSGKDEAHAIKEYAYYDDPTFEKLWGDVGDFEDGGNPYAELLPLTQTYGRPSWVKNYSAWSKMTDDEINAWYYIANTEGAEAAQEYLDNMQYILERRNTLQQEKRTQEGMENLGVAGGAAMGLLTVPANLIGNVTSFGSDVVNAVTGKKVNPYSKWHSLQNLSATTRSAANNQIEEAIAGDGSSKFMNFVAKAASQGYQAGLSTLDSLAGMGTLGKAYTITMGMGAASSRMRELHEAGASDEEIYHGAIGSGVLEALCEYASADKFAKNFLQENPEKWIKRMLVQAGVEAGEEINTEISNLILDAINRGVSSDVNVRVRELMNEDGLSYDEAKQKAHGEAAMDVFWAGYGGLISGGLSSVGGAIAESSRQNQLGSTILANNNQSQVLSEAKELAGNDKKVQKIVDKLSKNESAEDYKNWDKTRLGRLAEKTIARMASEDSRAVQNAVQTRLTELGANYGTEQTAEALAKQLAGKTLSVTDKYYLFVNQKKTDTVESEIRSLSKGATEENAWVRNIRSFSAGTRQTNASKAAQAAMETTIDNTFGPAAEGIKLAYIDGQNRDAYVSEMHTVYESARDGTAMDAIMETPNLTELQRDAAYKMGRGSVSDSNAYSYDSEGGGQSFLSRDGEKIPVNIAGVAQSGSGGLTLALDDGTTVDAKDVTFGSFGLSKLYSVITTLGVDASEANDIVSTAQEGGVGLNSYASALLEAYLDGRSGLPFDAISKDSPAQSLSEGQRRTAWRAGQDARSEQTARKQKTVDIGSHKKATGGLHMEKSAKALKNLNAQQKEAMNAARIFAAAGVDITVIASTEQQRKDGLDNGVFRASDGTITIDLNAGLNGEGVAAWTLSHELLHFAAEMSPEKFETLQDVVFAELGRDGVNVAELIEAKESALAKMEEYNLLSDEKLRTIAAEEVTAEALETMLTDTDAIARISARLKQTDAGLWEKIKGWISGLVEKLKKAYANLNPDGAIARQARSTVTRSEAILEAFVDAASDAVVNYNLQDGQKNNAPEGVRYQARTVNGNSIAWIENSGLTAKQLNDHKAVANYIAQHVGEVYTIIESGMKVYLGKDLPGEYTHSDYTSYLRKQGQSTLRAKNKAVDVLGEMIEISTNRRWEPTKHKHSKDAAYGMYRYDSKFAFPVKNAAGNTVEVRAYDVELLIRNASDGKKYLYDIVNIQKNTADSLDLQQRETRKGSHTLPTNGSVSKGSIAQGTQNVNTEVELKSSRNVQETKNLVALHNLTEEKLLKTLELGGFPMDGVRFSQRSTEDRLAAEQEKNQRLQDEIRYLKKVVQIQKTGNKDLTMDRNSVNKQAKLLMEAACAKGNTAELAGLLNDFYSYINSGNDITIEGLENAVGKVADWLEERRQTERDSYAQEVLSWLKGRSVRLNDEQLQNVRYAYGTLGAFKKAIRGTVTINKNANMDLDELWQEAAGQFPDQFGADIVDADMPTALAERVRALQELQSVDSLEREYYAEQTRQELEKQIYDSYWEAKPVQSVGAEKQEQIRQLKAEIRALRQENKASLKAIQEQSRAQIEAYRAQKTAEAQAEKQRYEEQYALVVNQYQKDLAELRRTYSDDTIFYQMEYFEKARTGEFRTANYVKKLSMLKQMAKEKSGIDGDEYNARMKEYEHLFGEDRLTDDIYRLQQKVEKQRLDAHAKVESRKATEKRGQIQKVANKLNRMLLNPTRTQYVPDHLQPAVIKFVMAMNKVQLSDSKIEAKIEQYERQLTRLKDGSDNADKIANIEAKIEVLKNKNVSIKSALETLAVSYKALEGRNDAHIPVTYDQTIMDFIDDALDVIGSTSYSKLSADKLDGVYQVYKAILTSIQKANKAFATDRDAEISTLQSNVRSELAQKESRGKLTDDTTRLLEKFSWNNEKPIYAFNRVGSDTLTQLYRNLRKGEDTWYQDFSAARAYAVGIMAKYNYDEWTDSLIEYTSTDGRTFSLSLEERMSMYAGSRRDQYIEHLTDGGMVLDENTKRTVKNRLGVRKTKIFNDYNAYSLSLDTIAEIGNSLTEEQRAFVEAMQSYLSTVCAGLNNEVSLALYGVSIAKEPNYWPIRSSGDFSERVRNSQNKPSNRQKNAAHMKSTVKGANNPVVVMGFMETWATHVVNTAMYHAFTLPMEDFYRVYNWKGGISEGDQKSESIRQMIADKCGKGALDYIDTLLDDLNGGLRADPRESLGTAMLSKFKKGAVSASLSVAIQQPSAIGRALAVIDAKYFVGKPFEGSIPKTWEIMKRYAPVVGIKEMGRFDVGMGRSTIDYLTGAGEKGVMAKVDEIAGWLPEKADMVTWCYIWEAAKRQTADQTGLKGEALLVKTGELFTKCITETQVYDSVFSRSGMMRSKSLWAKMATSFMAEPTTTANMVEQALRDFKNGDKKQAVRALVSVTVSTVLNSLLASLVYAARDDDEDRPYTEKYWQSVAAELLDGFNPITYIPIAKDIWSLLQGYDVERSDMALWSTAINCANYFAIAVEELHEADEDHRAEAIENLTEKSWDMAGALLNLGGIPLKNVVRDVRAITNTYHTVSEKRPMDSKTMGYALWEAWRGSLPKLLRDTDSKSEQIYKAVLSGSEVWQERLRNSYKDPADYETAVITALQEQDERITEAAQAMLDGDETLYRSLSKEIEAEGHFTREQIDDAVEKQIKKLPGALKDASSSAVEHYMDLAEQNLLTAEQFADFWSYRTAEGADGKALHNKGDIISYIANMGTNSKACDALYELCGYNEDTVQYMPWHVGGMTGSMWAKAYAYKNTKNADGTQKYDKDAIMAYINKLASSAKVKDAIYLSLGYKDTTLKDTPWH